MPTPTVLRSSLIDLSALAEADLRAFWKQFDTPDKARNALRELLPLLVSTYGIAAATLAADFYDETRAELNVNGRFSAVVDELGDDFGTDELARWGVAPLYAAKPDWKAAETLVAGGLQRRIVDRARDVITTSSVADPQARGWQRSASMGCAFCQMIASRGAVFTQSSVVFASHDNCRCVAVPAFDGREVPVKPYTPSLRTATDADRARVRAYLAEHFAG